MYVVASYGKSDYTQYLCLGSQHKTTPGTCPGVIYFTLRYHRVNIIILHVCRFGHSSGWLEKQASLGVLNRNVSTFGILTQTTTPGSGDVDQDLLEDRWVCMVSTSRPAGGSISWFHVT